MHAVLSLALAAGFLTGAGAPVVPTDAGPVRGRVSGEVRLYQGIPYAAPPTGDNRWRAPQPVEPWTEPLDATKPRDRCAQAGDFIGDRPSTSEDCLYLQVTAPRSASANHRLPVMVWIHGGGFFSGSGDVYDARRLARQGDVVVVNVNYRLGALGFLALPQLDAESGQLSGNYGLQDQQAALRWVKRNIAGFGGDPRSVTIFGESAGSISVCTHLAAPGSAGLFQRAIGTSGACANTGQWPYQETWMTRPRKTAFTQGKALAAKLKCQDVACLRGVAVPRLLEASDGGQTYGPVTGRGVLPLTPARAIATGRFQRVPVMVGGTRDEHATFTAAEEVFTKRATTAKDYRDHLALTFGARAGKVARAYPISRYGSPGGALTAIYTDYAWSCPTLRTAQGLARYVPTYGFEFADRKAPWFAGSAEPSFPTGAFHAGDLQYLFDGAYGTGKLTPRQRALADRMVAAWTRFARTGTVSWPRYDGSSGYVRSLDPAGDHRVDLGREHNCGFWSGF